MNLVLLLLWKAHSGIQVAQADIESLDRLVRDWREYVVRPLRHVRRHLKTVDNDAFDQAARLRKTIKAAELEAERQEQEALSHDVISLAQSIGRDILPSHEAARSNLAAYEAVIMSRLPADAVDALLASLASLPNSYPTNS